MLVLVGVCKLWKQMRSGGVDKKCDISAPKYRIDSPKVAPGFYDSLVAI